MPKILTMVNPNRKNSPTKWLTHQNYNFSINNQHIFISFEQCILYLKIQMNSWTAVTSFDLKLIFIFIYFNFNN